MAGMKRRLAQVMKMKELAEGRREDEDLILGLKKDLSDLRKFRKVVERIHTLSLGQQGKDVMPSDDEDEVEVQRKKRRKKKVLREEVPEQLIKHYRSHPCNPSYFPEHVLAKRSKSFREFYYVSKAMDDKYTEYHNALVDQFDAKGYAVDYSEVEDEDDEEEN